MPQCTKCGAQCEVTYEMGICSTCRKMHVAKLKQVGKKKPESKILSKETFEEEVERLERERRASARNDRRPSRSAPVTGWLMGVGFPVLWVACVVLVFVNFGFNRHFTIWSLSLAFFFVGMVMFLTRRVSWKGEFSSDVLEPKAANAIYLIVGCLWLLPCILCVLYYSFSTNDVREFSNKPIWFVSIALGIASLAQLICSWALTAKTETGEMARLQMSEEG